MNHEILTQVILDQHELIKSAQLVERRYEFDPNANYVLTGLRRAGKSMLLYRRALDLVNSGVDWLRIIYVNFEDERLSEFTSADFNDLLLVQRELSDEPGYFFLDEVQNVPSWEKFARRLADAKERVWITGSNARMLSSEIATTLGGRYIEQHVTPYRFDEYLNARQQPHDKRALLATAHRGRILGMFDDYLHNGGFPESLAYQAPRVYVENVYQKVLLGDIAARNGVRNVQALRILMKKIAETVCNEVSFSTLHGLLKTIGLSVGKDTVIDYVKQAQAAFLLFETQNAVAKFAERESNPRYYFADNGVLSLFLRDKDTALLENLVACALRDVFGDGLYYLKSPKTSIDVDFYVPDASLAVQVAYSIAGEARKREVGNLLKLSKTANAPELLVIVTKQESELIEQDGARIEVVPAYKFLLDLAQNQPA